ncbi:uncharacterized protein LOC113137053 isoform X2 [Mastacembelus armatus]|uniref:Uncharacterized LOC113137053 n=1 Tax=Mastacembelus armatus TaxID=205130 RepID=A0A3Q3MVM0_9TELE|nr:uncharacterized protein LOC113137053 isoform X2 [Mastacembelus armatus]
MHRGYKDYSPLRNMSEQEPPALVSWKTFHVHVAGKPNKAYDDFIKKLEEVGQTKVPSLEGCDYLLVFCPITSRVKTDISDALGKIQGDKPIILVVMHHTFDPEHTVAESRRQVTSQIVRLTVDCLFYENEFLKSKRNDIAVFEVQKFLGVTLSETSLWGKVKNFFCGWWRNSQKWIVGCAIVCGAVVVVISGGLIGGIFTRTKNSEGQNP